MSLLSLPELTKLVASVKTEGNINYVPYDIRDTHVFYGIPPVPMVGINRVLARYTSPSTRLVNCLTTKGVHATNKNKSGIIELEIMSGSVSGGAIQVIGYMNQPVPLFIEDTKTGGTSTIIAPECRLAETPAWRREATPGVDVWTFTSTTMTIIHGMRLVSDA